MPGVFPLVPHPGHPSRSRFIVKAGVRRRDARHLLLGFRIYREVDQIRWHDEILEGRADELWRHSCFEAFVGRVAAPDYVELNLAPAKRWALYAFAGYREGIRAIDDASVARMNFVRRDLSVPRVEMRVMLELPQRFAGEDWRLGLSTIIEETDGAKSYWALAHAPGPPDFHNSDCFVARLPAPRRR